MVAAERPCATPSRTSSGSPCVDVKPVGLAGSGGSTPLRIRLAGDPDTFVFGKLYAMNHVRADRWYKMGRTILYGRLEDEAPFQSVRRLVQYEDYALRVMRDAGIPTAAPLGVVELTPEREYLLVTEFFDGAVEISEADVDDSIIDEGLALVRRLWDAGLAHRDIKPANLMVRDGQLILIDVAFAQVRPSPWREAVDLANMMLVLAVRTDAERVYRRALTSSRPRRWPRRSPPPAASPARRSCARSMKPGRSGPRRPVPRAWPPSGGPSRCSGGGRAGCSPRSRPGAGPRWRLVNVYGMFTPAQLPIRSKPACGTEQVMVLMAQAVPSAAAVPCVASLPAGWSSVGLIRRGDAKFWLDSDVAGDAAVEVRLRGPGECDLEGAVEVPSDELVVAAVRAPRASAAGLAATRVYLVDGACVTYEFDFDGEVGRVGDDHPRRRARLPAPRRARRRRRAAVRAGPLRVRRAAVPGGRVTPIARDLLGAVLRVLIGLSLAVVTTSLSLRLLGLRRGWVSGLPRRHHRLGRWRSSSRSGVNQWDWGADGLIVHLVAIGIPTTMAVAVALDLLARPGSLAVGERAGLVVMPRPIRAVRRRVAVFRRYRELVGLARQEGFVPFRSGPDAGATPRGAAAPGARAGRRGVRQARADRGDARRPAAARGVRRAGLTPEPGAARAARGRSRPYSPPSSAISTPCSQTSTGNRWRRRRSVRPIAPRCSAARSSSSRCSGRASKRRWSATSPPSRCWPSWPSAARRSGGACDRARCWPSSPTGCGPSSTSGAKPMRWRRWRRSSSHVGGAHPDAASRAVDAPRPRPGALRGAHGRRSRRRGQHRVRPTDAGRRGCCARSSTR